MPGSLADSSGQGSLRHRVGRQEACDLLPEVGDGMFLAAHQSLKASFLGTVVLGVEEEGVGLALAFLAIRRLRLGGVIGPTYIISIDCQPSPYLDA